MNKVKGTRGIEQATENLNSSLMAYGEEEAMNELRLIMKGKGVEVRLQEELDGPVVLQTHTADELFQLVDFYAFAMEDDKAFQLMSLCYDVTQVSIRVLLTDVLRLDQEDVEAIKEHTKRDV